jgi:protein-S-isoprenylcysteine O-methyltransferase Ste14
LELRLRVTFGPSEIIDVIWIVWLASWIAASFWSGRTERRIGTLEPWRYRAAMIVGGILLFPGTGRVLEQKPLWQVGTPGGYAFVVLMLAGLAFSWWARIHLGRLWSSAITRKDGHRIVYTGPYALVRHPIYTGLIVGLVATVAVDGTITALIGGALVVFGLWLKARAEERFLMTELGADAYGPYCRRVPMLIPFIAIRR